MTFDLAVTGDAVLNDRISGCEHDGFRDLVERLRAADVALTHLETTCHDYDEPGVVPAAVAGGTWMRAPRSTGDELAWAGIDVVTHASNHALDFSYGGLRETWRVLDDAGVAHAGTGETLAAAREPAFVDTPQARIGVVSMTASFPPWSRAGHARTDMRGRPGVNALRFSYEADDDTLEAIRDLGTALGYVVVETDDAVTLTDPASRNMVTRFQRSAEDAEDARDAKGAEAFGDVTGARRVLEERDREGNLRAIEDAAAAADVVVTHVHTHEFRAGGDVTQPPRFLEAFARDAVDRGADVVVCQGSHAPTRGIEIHDGAPIFHDPGDFVIMADAVTRQPADFYEANEDRLDRHPADATVAEAIEARGPIRPWESGTVFANERQMHSPTDGFFTGPGSVLATCRFDDATDDTSDDATGDVGVESVELVPVTWLSEPTAHVGIPVRAEGELADRILEHVAELSADYGTTVAHEDGVGRIDVA